MDNSEAQFEELIAHLTARLNRSVAKGEMALLRLLLRSDGAVEAAVGIADTDSERQEVLEAMQESAKGLVAQGSIEAVCIAYPANGGQVYVAMLENRENYCCKVIIPVLGAPAPGLDLENMILEDGHVEVFPYVDAE